MKRIILFLAILATGALLQAQTPDSNARGDEVVSSRGSLRFGSNVPTRQLRIANETPQNNKGLSLKDQYADSEASEWFLEGKALLFSLTGVGLQAAYVPGHFGAYGTFAVGSDRYFRHTVLAAGAVLRPVARPRWLDFQVYGGLAGGYGVGFECGFRFAAVSNTRFSWVSGSYGWIFTNKGTIVTLGVSIDLAVISGLSIRFF